eukprot:6181475-Pleurochrysis_carterae.AAC.2
MARAALQSSMQPLKSEACVDKAPSFYHFDAQTTSNTSKVHGAVASAEASRGTRASIGYLRVPKLSIPEEEGFNSGKTEILNKYIEAASDSHESAGEERPATLDETGKWRARREVRATYGSGGKECERACDANERGQETIRIKCSVLREAKNGKKRWSRNR